jgi:phosphoglycolate phosphatase
MSPDRRAAHADARVAIRRLRAVLFDFDHTLSDFGRWVEWRAARAEIAAFYERDGVDVARVIARGGSFSLIAALDAELAAATSRAHAEAVRAEAFAILERHECAGAARAGLLPGAAACLAHAEAAGLALAIVSANAESAIRRALGRLGVERCFGAVVGRTLDRPLKPEPDMHREALRLLGCPAETALVVGDSTSDMAGAAAAGILAVGIGGGEGSEQNLFAAGAAWVLADLTALPTLLAWWAGAAEEE